MLLHRGAGPLRFISLVSLVSLSVLLVVLCALGFPGCGKRVTAPSLAGAAADGSAVTASHGDSSSALSEPAGAGGLRGVRRGRAAVQPVNAGVAPDGAATVPAAEAEAAEAAVLAFPDIFVRKDIAAYAAFLSPDFAFRFRPQDGPVFPDTLDRGGELSFARHVFFGGAASGAPAAERIELELQVLERRFERLRGGVSWARFTLMSHLRLQLPGGEVIRVDSPVAFDLRLEGSETRTWRLVQWVELPFPGGEAAVSAR